jgi:hypothetical protein
MPVSTTLQCPHCQYSTTTSKVVLPDTNIRCPKCKSVFQLVATPQGMIETIPVGDELRKNTLLEVTSASVSSGQPGIQPRYLQETVLPAPERPPEPKPTPSIKPGKSKPPPFRSSRTFLTITGAAVAVLAVGAFAAWYAITFWGFMHSSEIIAQERAEKYKAGPGSRSKAAQGAIVPPTVTLPPFKAQVMIGAEAPKTTPAPASEPDIVGGRVVAPRAQKIGALNVSVVDAHRGRLNRAIASEYLLVRVRVTNLSFGIITFSRWSHAKIPVILKDDKGIYYNIQRASGEAQIQIQPGKSIFDTLIFDATPPFAQLDLDLPIVGTDKAFQFHTDGGFIQNAPVPLEELAQLSDVPAPPGVPPVPPQPRFKDPEIRRKVRNEYQKRGREIADRVKTMGFNEGTQYRRRERKKLLKDLAEKYKLEPDEIDEILAASI